MAYTRQGLMTVKDRFCRLSPIEPSKPEGYIQVSIGGANKFMVLRGLVLASQGLYVGEGQQRSHLCGWLACVVPRHIVVVGIVVVVEIGVVVCVY